MRIAIIDDIAFETQPLIKTYKTWLTKHNLKGSYDFFTSGEEFLQSYKEGIYSIIFIDIYMKGISGVETAKEVRALDSHVLLVFLTSSNEHVWDAFPLHAFDYLLKGCEEQKILSVLDEAYKVIPTLEKSITLKVGRQKIAVLYTNIMYATSDDHHTLVQVTHQKEPLRAYISFSDISKQLSEDTQFLLCNRGILLNQRYIKTLKEDCFVMRDGAQFPIRKSNQSAIKEAFYSYQFQSLQP